MAGVVPLVVAGVVKPDLEGDFGGNVRADSPPVARSVMSGAVPRVVESNVGSIVRSVLPCVVPREFGDISP